MENVREVLKIVVAGHVDHGKSTVIGRLLYDTKSLPEGAIERVKRISKEKGKPFEYAYLLDAFEEEQKQGITIDTTQLQFHTDKRDYVIIDAPGHKEFLKNMISGAANAEAALLIIDAGEGIQEQSKRHGYILSLLGIQKIYVIVNKMDLIDYSEEKFKAIRKEMNQFLNSLNVYPLKYIPISAFLGENLTHRSEKMPWYDGEPVLEAMDLFEKDKGLVDKPLRFPIQDVYKFDSRRIIAGRIESGRLKVGDEILLSPGNKVTRVKSIEYWADRDRRDSVEAGMSVGITVEDEFFNKRGEFISHREGAPVTSNLFKANIFWMGKKELVKNRKYKLKLVTQEVECEIHSVNKVIDATTLETLENAEAVKTNDVAEVTVKTREKVSFDAFKDNQNTGRFVIVDGYDVSGGGIISGTAEQEPEGVKFVKGDTVLDVHCFDEYYFLIPNGKFQRVEAGAKVYRIGSDIPTAGETYNFPDNFDVIDLVHGAAAKIRGRKLEDLVELDDYQYGKHPVVDTVGAYIKIENPEDINRFKREFESFSLNNIQERVSFANKWYDLMKFRRIQYKEDLDDVGAEYNI